LCFRSSTHMPSTGWRKWPFIQTKTGPNASFPVCCEDEIPQCIPNRPTWLNIYLHFPHFFLFLVQFVYGNIYIGNAKMELAVATISEMN